MQNLFNEAEFTAEITKIASKKVSNNPAEWSKQAIEYFYDQYPMAIGQPIRVQFKEKDPKKGYAVGSIQIGPFSVPILINAFVMAPHDIAIRSDGVLTPFNTEVIELTMAGASPFMRIDIRPKDINGYTSFDRALGYAGSAPGSDMVADTSKVGSVLNELDKLGCITVKGKHQIVSTIKEDEMVGLSYKQNEDAMNTLGKVAGMSASDGVNTFDTIRKNYPRDLQYLYKVGNCEYEMIIGSSEIDDPIVVRVPEEKIDGVESIKTAPREKIASRYINKDKEGSLLPLRDSQALFITKTGEFVRLNGEFTNSNGEFNTIGIPNPGDYGLFAVNDSKSGYVGVSEPFNVVKVASTPLSMSIEGHIAYTPRNFEVIRTENTDLIAHETDKTASYVPGNAVFIKLGKELNSEALIPDLAANIHGIHAFGGHKYTWKGPVLAKYASDHSLNECEHCKLDTIWALIQTGADEDTINKVASLKQGHALNIDTRLKNVPLLSKLASTIESDFDKGDYHGGYWTKLAAWMPSPESVDAILSLNFLNKNTINEFIELLPLFEETAHHLSRLLLGVRMGLRNMDESPLVESIQALSQVITMLYGAKNVNKMKK